MPVLNVKPWSPIHFSKANMYAPRAVPRNNLNDKNDRFEANPNLFLTWFSDKDKSPPVVVAQRNGY